MYTSKDADVTNMRKNSKQLWNIRRRERTDNTKDEKKVNALRPLVNVYESCEDSQHLLQRAVPSGVAAAKKHTTRSVLG